MNVNFFVGHGESIEIGFEFMDENGLITREKMTCGVTGQDKPRTFYLNLNGKKLFQNEAWNERDINNEIIDKSERTYFPIK